MSHKIIDHSFDYKHGFLPEPDPLQQLPTGFTPLEEICAQLPKLLISNNFRAELENMPWSEIELLKSAPELERAMMLFSFLGHAYVWGVNPQVTKIPRSIAVPWYQVAEKIGRPPILSYASYALHNWRRINPRQPIALGNIVLLQNFLGGIDEEWFVLVHVDIEAKAIPAIVNIVAGQQAVSQHDTASLVNALQSIAQSLAAMCATLDRMPEHCDPYIYYNRVRPYIHGWEDNPALPQGIIYENVAAYNNKPQKFRGETGAQSSIIPALDAALGIVHKADPLQSYLLEMYQYMPIKHRAFIATIATNPSIRNFVKEHQQQIPLLREYYNNCLQLLIRFRQTHLRYAAEYIHKQSQSSIANPTAIGTGGTPFMVYLKKHKDELEQYLLPFS